MRELQRTDLIYPAFSYQIVGILFEVFKQLGNGYQEKHYQKAVAEELKRSGLRFKEQVSMPLLYKEKKIGNYFLDFLVEDKIIVELKKDCLFQNKTKDKRLSLSESQAELPPAILVQKARNQLSKQVKKSPKKKQKRSKKPELPRR